jgi:hypothetical protein
LYAAVLLRPEGAAPVNGKVRVSLPTGAIAGAAASGVVTAAPGAATAAPASPGGASTSTRPTRMTLTFSMLFHAASSR